MEGIKDLAPYATIVGAVLGLVVLGVRLMFRGGLVPRITVTDMQAQHKSQLETVKESYERIIKLYQDESVTKQKIIDTLSASVDKLADAQHTTNALIRSLADAAETSRQLAAREPQS